MTTSENLHARGGQSQRQCLKSETSTSCDEHQLLGGESQLGSKFLRQSASSQTKTTQSSAQNDEMISLCQILSFFFIWKGVTQLNAPTSNKWMRLIATSSTLEYGWRDVCLSENSYFLGVNSIMWKGSENVCLPVSRWLPGGTDKMWG